MQRNISLDMLKLLLALMVVAIHTKFLSETNAILSHLLVDGLFRLAVPVFFVINGYFFCMSVEKNDVFRWVKRIVILYVVWMLVYSVFWVDLTSFSGVKRSLFMVFFGYYHLWYLVGVAGAAVLFFSLHKLGVSDFLLILLSVLLFITGIAIQYSGNYHLFGSGLLDELFNVIQIYRNFLFFSFPFFCLGFFINKYDVGSEVPLGLIFLAVFVGCVCLIVESYVNYLYAPSGEVFDLYLSIFVVCPAVFLLFLKGEFRADVSVLSVYSSSIYLVHPFVFIVIWECFSEVGSVVSISVLVLSVLISFFLIKLDKVIKFVL